MAKRLFTIVLIFISIRHDVKCQWNIIYSSDTLLTAVNFVSPDSGFIGGEGLLKRTTDGGIHWNDCNGFTSESKILDIDFVSNDLMFLSSLEEQPIWKSIDGGADWENISDILVGGPIYDLDVVSDDISYGGGLGGYVYKTDDGFDFLNIYNVSAEDILSISFPDSDTGYVAGGLYAFLKTENGAETWIDVNTMFINALLVDFCSPATGYVTDQYDLYRTNNYGNTWNLLTIPGPMDRILALECVSDLVCYIAGDDPLGNSYILKTTDGGESWINTVIDPTLSPPNKIVCVNDSVCYALSSNGLGNAFYVLKTNNSGGITSTFETIITTQYYLYPNPANDLVHLSLLNQESIMQITTFNLLGEVVNVKFDNSLNAFINSLPNSYYMTEVVCNDGKYFIYWVKQ
ncbi:MAG: T9SS type A sorting domain-containing protein [Chitinophagales bacterium]